MKSSILRSENFSKCYVSIRKSKTLTGNEKLLITYILGWQESGKECYQSNTTIADELGLSTYGLEKIITKLNKLPFFSSKKVTSQNEHGKWVNTKVMTVDEELLQQYLSEPKTVKPAQVKIEEPVVIIPKVTIQPDPIIIETIKEEPITIKSEETIEEKRLRWKRESDEKWKEVELMKERLKIYELESQVQEVNEINVRDLFLPQ